MLTAAMVEIQRVLRPGGHAAVEVSAKSAVEKSSSKSMSLPAAKRLGLIP